jgi:CRP-like cAMP-binding protein
VDARTILRKNAAILKLDDHTIDDLARVTAVQRLRRGEALWRAGERANSLVIVGHGLVKVLLPATGARDLVLGL